MVNLGVQGRIGSDLERRGGEWTFSDLERDFGPPPVASTINSPLRFGDVAFALDDFEEGHMWF